MVETSDDTFIDDLTCKTDYEIPLYFRETFNENANFMGTQTFESLFFEDNYKNVNNSINSDNLEEDSKDSKVSKDSDYTNYITICNKFLVSLLLLELIQ